MPRGSGFGCYFGNFFQRNFPRGGDRFRYDARMRRFAALSTERDGRQIGTISFHHEFPERDLRCDFSRGRAVFESDNSRERNEVVKAENFVRLIQCASETMKNAAQLARVWLHDFQRVLPGVALMDHCVEPKLNSEVELLLK